MLKLFERPERGKGTSRVLVEKFPSDEAYEEAKRIAGGPWNALRFCDQIESLWRRAVWFLTADGAVLRVKVGDLTDHSRADQRILEALSLAGAVLVGRGNVFLNQGTEELWNRLTGVGTIDQLFDNAHARIGVGDSNAAAVRTQVGLQAGANTAFSGMEAGFPTVTAGDAGGGAKTDYKSVFGGAAANFSHQEWVVDNKNGAPAGAITINRKVQDFGLKAAGSTWTYTMQLRID